MRNILPKESDPLQSKDARDTNVTIWSIIIQRCARYKRNNLINYNQEMRKVLTQQTDQLQSKDAQDTNATIWPITQLIKTITKFSNLIGYHQLDL